MIKYEKPKVEDIRVNVNFGHPEGTRGQNSPIAIVYHVEQGTQAGTNAWFANDASDALAHYSIARNGKIYWHCDEENTPFANGRVQKPTWKLLKPFDGSNWNLLSTDKYTGKQYLNPNAYTLSVEHEGMSGQPFTEEQYKSDIALTLYLVSKYNIPVDEDHLITHAMIDSVDRPHCPGSTFPLKKLISDVRNIIVKDDIKMALSKHFKDIPENLEWAVESADRMYERGILKGDGSGNVNLSANVTKAEVVVLIDRAVEYIFSKIISSIESLNK